MNQAFDKEKSGSQIDYKAEFVSIGRKARSAARQLAVLPTSVKDQCLRRVADQLDLDRRFIESQNQIDLDAGKDKNLTDAMLDRLRLADDRIDAIISGLHDLTNLKDPVGDVLDKFTLANGLQISKTRVPIGVIAIIYESRPNVTIDAAGLCLKAGNAVILKGGSEAIRTNLALGRSMATALERCHVVPESVQILPWTDRNAVSHLLKLNQSVDLIIPRGGEGLIRYVTEHSTIPVIKHYKGICHVYVDRDCDIDSALRIIENGKCQRPGVCNAVETVLIHKDIAASISNRLYELLNKNGVEVRADSAFRAFVPGAKAASTEDWDEEYLDRIIAIRIVDSLNSAMDHIADHGSAHSDAIVSRDPQACERFLNEVDSAVVYANASTRFTDGGQFGMGAEIGISTDRIHARGPMGINELTTYKYIVRGDGQIRE